MAQKHGEDRLPLPMAETTVERSRMLDRASSCFRGTKRMDSCEEAHPPASVFGEIAFEAAYSFVANEDSRIVVIAGPFSFLKKHTKRDPEKNTPELRRRVSEEESSFPSTRRFVDVVPGTSLHLASTDRICDQHAFRNEQYPLEVAISAMLVCAERWNPERKRLLQDLAGEGAPCNAKEKVCVENIVNECGSLRNSEGAKRLRKFDVITSRRALRALLCFLFPGSSPYGKAFDIDVTISGNTIILNVVTEPVRAHSVGYGVDFERLLVQPVFVNEVDRKGVSTGGAELTNGYVVQSMLLCGTLRVAVSAETDAIAPQFNPLQKSIRPEFCCSIHGETSGRNCVFSRQTIGSNDCLVHNCKQLSLLEEQLLQCAAPLAELKSFSEVRGLAWEAAADQMRLGGARMLVTGPHIRGSIRHVQVLPLRDVEKEANSAATDEEKWQGLTVLLQKLHELAADARGKSGDEVGCVRVRHDGLSSQLKVENRGAENIRVSQEVASWFR
ncbi:hypothetical protein Emag_001242 [Eimeria magna]